MLLAAIWGAILISNSASLHCSALMMACGTVADPIPPGWTAPIPPGMDPIPPGIEARRRGGDHL
eukprot:scaffold22480_cov93-Skeletonema_dohrnii-CCMP3373.AAC.2